MTRKSIGTGASRRRFPTERAATVVAQRPLLQDWLRGHQPDPADADGVAILAGLLEGSDR
jgi:hypothetical protein